MNLLAPVYLEVRFISITPPHVILLSRTRFRWRWLALLHWSPPHGGLRCEIVPATVVTERVVRPTFPLQPLDESFDDFLGTGHPEREFTDHTEELRFAPRRDER